MSADDALFMLGLLGILTVTFFLLGVKLFHLLD